MFVVPLILDIIVDMRSDLNGFLLYPTGEKQSIFVMSACGERGCILDDLCVDNIAAGQK